MKKFLFAGIVLAVCLGVWFFAARQGGGKIRNVLLISIDTCRADYLSCYGYKQNTTPNIDAVAAEGVLFENAISPIPLTLPGHSSMLTGRTPPCHGVRDNFEYQLGESNVTIAEILRDNGFATGAIISAFVLDSIFGINQGFEIYNDKFEEVRKAGTIDERTGDESTRLAIEWLQKHKDEPFFYFLHYYDPHKPYDPPEPFSTKFADNLYAGEIAFADHCIGQVIQKLKDIDLYDSTLIIITGDHGESLGQHSEDTHSFFIYQSALHVPLTIRVPNGPKGKRIADIAGLIDIVPTICGLLDIALPSNLQGQDLSRYFKKKTDITQEQRYLYCESLVPTKFDCAPLFGLLDGRWKYIQAPRPELYNLIKDPDELENLAIKDVKRARLMRDNLKLILEGDMRSDQTDNKLVSDEKTKKRLESLGYVVGSTPINEKIEFDQNANDPKDFIHLYDTTVAARMYSLGAAMAKLKNPELAGMAAKFFEKATKANPDAVQAHYGLAKDMRRHGKVADAIEEYKKVLEIDPDRFKVHNKLADLYCEQNDIKQGLEHLYKSLQINPNQPETLKKIAWIRATNQNEQIRNPDEAVKLAKQACKSADYEDPDKLSTLAAAYASANNFDKAVQTAEKALRLAVSSGLNPLAEEIKKHILLYKENKPYYEQH